MALRSFDDVSVGYELPERIVMLTRGDLVNYAGVSGDPNPIHWSDEVVRLAGLDNVIAHGMLTMGLGAGFGGPETLAWTAATAATGVELPGGGQVLFPGRRMVALYGTPGTGALAAAGDRSAS